MMIGVVLTGEKYAFNSHHKYKMIDKKNDTYEFEFDLQTNKLSVKVKEQLTRKDGLVSYILFENNKILVDENRKSKCKVLILHTQLVSLLYL